MKMKKLLASALAAAMVVSSMVGTLVTSAATSVGTITAGTVNAVVGETDTITADINIAFPNGVVAPHNIITIALDGYNLSDVELGEVTYTSSTEGVVEIDADGSNLAAGKVLLECPVDSKAPTVTAIALTATFVDADETDTVAGTYAIVVSGDDMTDVNEADIAIDAVNGSLVVAEPHVCVPETRYDENGHWTECECGETSEVTPHTLGDAAEAEDGKWYQSCECGYSVEVDAPVTGPVVDSALVVAGASVGYGTSSLQVGFRVRKAVLQLYNSVELVIVPQKYDTTTLNLVASPEEIVVPLAVGGAFTTYTYTDIQLYELGLNIDYMLRAYDAEGNLVAVSEDFSTSAASFLKTTFASSTDAKLRTLITDTLVVGANSVAGTAANYPDSDLAKATSIIEGFDTSEATPSVDSYNTVDNFTSYDSRFDTPTTATHRVMKSVTIGKAPYIGFRIKDAKSALDLSKISYKVSYTQNQGKGVEVPYEKTFSSENTTISKAGQFITFAFDEIGLQDGNKNIAIELYYDGAKVADMEYSIETYLGSMMSNATVGELTTSLIKLGISFRAYANA